MTTTPSIPPQFDEQFLDWFRERTEAYWAALPLQTADEILAPFVNAQVGHVGWQHGTRWLGGLREDEIAAIEQQWNLRFPPDYRLFLRHLHSIDKGDLRAGYISRDELTAPYANKYLATAFVTDFSYMALIEGTAFYNWQTGTDQINSMHTWLLHGLQFDVEHNDLWLDSWGDRPTNLDEQMQRVHDLVLAAPKLIPIYSHRCLLAEPCVPNNPVLSIHQSDIIVYGANLRDYLIHEFRQELQLTTSEYQADQEANRARIDAAYQAVAAIPFWGEIITM